MPRTALRRYFRHGLLPQLMVFEAVARLGSVTKAAETLHLAQPTVSLQLRKLADTLEVQLFVQRGRQLCLTPAGQELLAACEELIALLQRTDARLAPFRGGAGETLRIAAVSGARQLAARMLALFCAQYPGVQASLHVANCTQAMERLLAHEDDLAILSVPDDAPRVRAQLLATETLCFYCAPSHALASAGSVALPQVAAAMFVVREPGSGTRALLHELLRRAGHDLRVRAELEGDEAVAEAAAAGLGVALLPEAVAVPFVATGSLTAIRLEMPSLVRNWHLAHLEGATLPAAALLFIAQAANDAQQARAQSSLMPLVTVAHIARSFAACAAMVSALPGHLS